MYFMYEDFYLHLFVLGMVILFTIWLYRIYQIRESKNKEGFTQSQTYVCKSNDSDELYDGFYSEKYDTLYETDKYSEDDFMNLLTYTNHSSHDSTFLDIGCGTGSLLKRLENNQYHAFGIDKSRAMVEEAQSRLFSAEVIQDDVLRDAMLYDNGSFSHIVCTHFTLYEIENKKKLFRHCFHWLRSGGYLIVHVIEPENFNMMTPHSDLYEQSYIQNKSEERIVNTVIETPEYTFKTSYIFGNPFDTMTQIETFEQNMKVRRNEKPLYMISKEDVLHLARENGFQVYAEAKYSKIKDEHQSLIIFIKPMCGDI